MKKRFFSLLLVLAMVLSLLPVTTFAADIVDSGTCGDNVTWTLDSDGVLTISGTGAMRDYDFETGSEFPYYNDALINRIVIRQGVTSIGDFAFYYCSAPTSVTIPNSVTRIGHFAFAYWGSDINVFYDGTVQQWESISFRESKERGFITGTVQCRDGIAKPRSVRSTVELNGDKAPNGNRDGETNLGDLVADSILWAGMKEGNLKVGADRVVAIMNGGGIRAWIHVGDVTTKDVYSVHPFGNTVAVVYVTGAQLLEALEASTFKTPEASGAFPQVSGMKFTLNTGKPFDQGEQYPDSTYYGPRSIQRVTINEVNGKPFDKNAVYAVVTNDFCAAGGDTYHAFKAASNQFDTGIQLDDALMNYIVEKLGGVIGSDYAAPQGRIVIVDQPTGPSDPGNPGEMEILPPMETDGNFRYYATHLKDHDKLIEKEQAEYSFHYDESWFENSSSRYQHDLAKMSLRMTMAGMGRTDSNDATNYSNIEKLFKELKYTNLSFTYPKTEANSIGYAIGSKNIQGNDGNAYSLISVVIRSSGYFEEWGGNVTLGQSGNHKGFQVAADKVIDGFDDHEGVFGYIERLQKSGKLTQNVKIWITGYSRGAATANLAAARLNKVYGKGNVFAYCFECPQGAVDKDANSSKYDNIFCIVNPIDLVPKVAMSVWDFSRYGQTYYLPARSNSAEYSQLKSKMLEEYKTILYKNGTANLKEGVEKVTKELQVKGLLEQGVLFDQFVGTIARNMGSRFLYYQLFEDNFSRAVANLMSDSGASAKDKAVVLLLLLYELFNYNGSTINMSNPDMLLGVEIPTLAIYMRYAHYPELCVAWLDALDGAMVCSKKAGYRTVFVNCPVDVSVYDSSNHLVAKIVNDVPQEIEDGISAYLDENGQKVFILPMDMQYTLDIQATGSGTMTFTAADYDMDSGSYTQVVSYQDVPIQTGDQLRGTASQSDQETADYTLKGADNQTIRPSEKATGKDVPVWSVTAAAQEGGTVSGGGIFVVGEYARVSAEAESGYRFLGWFEGEKKVSEDAEYRFSVEKDTAMTAKFERTTPQPSNPFTDVKESAYYYEPVLWAVNHIPQITNGTGDKTFSPEWECLRCQIVTFLWRAMGCPEPTSTVNPFVDVKPSDYFYKAVLWAVEKEITNGMDLTHFGPNLTCTRGQAVTFLWRAEGKPAPRTQASEFTDVQNPNDYFYTPVLWAVENGITNGTGNGLFSPNMICLREQIVTFLYRDLAK